MTIAITGVFDYVIVGGGTAGLVIAARLTETADISVCVLEAGQDVTNTREASVPALAAELHMKDTNWGFESVPQEHSNGRTLSLVRGKGLGGSSMANLMQMNRAPAYEYDALERIGNAGWNSAEFLKYFTKSQTLAYDPNEVEALGLKPNKEEFGNGPVFNTLSRHQPSYNSNWIKAFEECGVPHNLNAMGGETFGVWLGSNSIHPETATRISSATAYYEPNKHRKNLTVITGAHVTRIKLGKSSPNAPGEPVAEGVEYQKEGQVCAVHARKEVILAAGAIQTPQILELSGIGRTAVLEKFNIPTVVSLPGVGENYHAEDHFAILMVYELQPGHSSYDILRVPEIAAEEASKYAEKKEGLLSSYPLNYAFVPLSKLGDVQTLQEYANQRGWDNIPEPIAKLQQEWTKSEHGLQLEILVLSFFYPTAAKPQPDPGKQYITIVAILLHPFSRGTIHITSPDPFSHPTIDPSALDNDYDVGVFLKGIKFIRKVAETDAFRGIARREVAPGAQVSEDQDLINYLKSGLTTAFHPIGTASMMKREDGGVVDEKLRVYGIKGLRIVDASVLPFQIAAHPQATVYAIGEKAADLITEDF